MAARRRRTAGCGIRRRYRIVVLDQRGCGRSTPHASDPDADLSHNTTWDLVADLERLREHRRIERWQVFGGSWGSSLALAYAETHPDRVSELIVRGIFTLRRSELDFYYNGPAGQLWPERYEEFLAPLGGRTFRGDAIAAYHALLFDPDPQIHGPAGVAWTTWEAATVKLVAGPGPDRRVLRARFRSGLRPDREPLLRQRRLVHATGS